MLRIGWSNTRRKTVDRLILARWERIRRRETRATPTTGRSRVPRAQILNGGQASGLAEQIPAAGIQYVVLMGGGDDYAPGNAAWNGIYNGTWTSTQINSYVNQTVANLGTAVTTMPVGTKLAIATISGFSNTPATKAAYPDPTKLQLVDNVLAQVNAGIMGLAQTDHLVVADVASLTNLVFGTAANPNTTVVIGGVTINLTQKTASNPSTAGFVNDGVHPNTVLQGVLGNIIMKAVDTGYNAAVPLFSEAQLLAHQGLSYGGSDTLAAQIGPYSNYVVSYVTRPDTNNDGVVNGLDVALISSQWLQTGWGLPGDANGDGVVNGLDIAIVSSNWLQASGAGQGVMIPEPATVILAALGGLALLAYRRRR